MTNGKVDIEIFRAWSGCRWCWDIWADEQPLCSGVNDTLDEAMSAVHNAIELHGLEKPKEDDE